MRAIYYSLFCILFATLLLSCDKNDKYLYVPKESKKNIVYPEWTKAFKNFQNAIQLSDTSAIVSYFDFPFPANQSEIWFFTIALNENSDPKDSKPFTADDFRKYYDKVFPPSLVKALAAVNIDEVFEKGVSETQNKYFGKVYHRAKAEYKAENNEVYIRVSRGSPVVYTDVNGKSEIDKTEINLVFIFKIIDNEKIRIQPMKVVA